MQNEKTKKTKWALRLAGVLVVTILLAVITLFAIKSQNDLQTVLINDIKISVEIATTSQQQARGLCCRTTLKDGHGMLFMYSQPGVHRFWMKDTLIPLDMYWIDKSNKIIHIEHNVQPSSYPKTFGPEADSLYVLETNAGFAEARNIRVGDIAEFDF